MDVLGVFRKGKEGGAARLELNVGQESRWGQRKAVVSGRRALNAIPSSLDVLAALDGEIFESKNYRIQLKRTTWAAKSRIDSREVKNPQVSMLINSSVSLACD